MFRMVLLVCAMGILAAQFSSTPETVTLSSKSPEVQNVSETLCERGCNNITCRLDKQSLEEIPSCIPRSVEELDLSFNNLQVIWEQNVTDLSQLKKLSLAHNQIREVVWKSHVLPQLTSLDLSHNHLVAVPECFMLKNVQWLSLAGNPIAHIGPVAFTCFPNLESLNLSSTLIGNSFSGDIEESAFALDKTTTSENFLTSLKVLDLSDTYLRRVNQVWSKDLPNLKMLHLRRMINMESLEDDLTEMFPHLEVLNCTGSQALSLVSMSFFRMSPEGLLLSFQDCNLTSFPHLNVTSGKIVVDLRGNPLICTCKVTGLFSDPEKLSLFRPHETICNALEGDNPDMNLEELNLYCKRSTLYTSAITKTDLVTGKQGIGVTPTPTPQNIGEPPHIPETVTVFKTTAADTTDVSPKQQTSSPVQGTDSLVTKIGFTKSSTTSLNSFVGTSSSSIYSTQSSLVTPEEDSTKSSLVTPKEYSTQSSLVTPEEDSTQSSLVTPKEYSTQSSLVTPEGYSTQSSLVTPKGHTTESIVKVFSGPASSTKAGFVQSITEDSSNKKQGGTPHEYQDYYDYSQPNITELKSTISACEFDGCRHLQIPCIELQQLKSCSCPGLSGKDVIPDPPYLKNMSEITDSSAQIHWCSPNSEVEKFQLVYQTVGGPMKTVDNIYVTIRQYTLYDLTPFTTYKVCVLAFNRAGQSEASGTSCTEFHTKPSYIMIFALICALCGLFIVIIVGLAVLLHKAYKNTMVNQYDTHLVSYKNPAFEYHLTIPSYH